MAKVGQFRALIALKSGHRDIGLTVNTYGHIRAEDHNPANDAETAYLVRITAKATGTDDT